MKISRAVGTASEILNVFVQNATVSTGAGLANIVASSVNFTWLRNDQATFSSGTCSSGGTIGTYNVSMFTQVSSTSSLGWYQFGVPNGIFTSGSSALLHLYGAPNMAPVPIEIELTKFDNQQYVSTYDVRSVTNPVGVSTVTDKGGYGVSTGVGVSSFAIRVGVSTQVGVSSGTWIAAVSSMQTEVGVSTIVPVGVSSPAGISSFTLPVGVSSFGIRVGISSLVSTGISTDAFSQIGFMVSTGVGVSSFALPVGVSSMTSSGLFDMFSVDGGNYSSASANSVVKQIADNAGGSALSEGGISSAVWKGVSTLAGVSSQLWVAGVSTVTDRVGVSAFALPVGVSSFGIAVGVSSFGIPVGVSTAVNLNATYGPAGSISTNIVQIAGTPVIGTGVSSDLWRA